MIGKFVVLAPSNKVVQQPASNKNVGGGGGGGSPLNVSWDPARTGGSIQLTESNTHCFLKEQSYLFRTTVGNQGYTSGIHYW